MILEVSEIFFYAPPSHFLFSFRSLSGCIHISYLLFETLNCTFLSHFCYFSINSDTNKNPSAEIYTVYVDSFFYFSLH